MDARVGHWAKRGARASRDRQHLSALMRDAAFRLERRWARRFGDVILGQLRSMERAYSAVNGPDLLVFGDSTMFWTAPSDKDPRHVVHMVRDDLGPRVSVEAAVGPLYNARLVMAFLAALEHCRSRPRLILVPLSVMMSQSIWLASPEFGYEQTSLELLAIISRGRRGRPRRLSQADEEAVLAWERLPAPSLYGARRTVGEIQLITNATPYTRWQGIIRLRHLMDSYNAERLEPSSPGVQLAGEMAAALARLGVPALAYVPPVNHEVIRSALGAAAHDHVRANVDLLTETFLSHCGDRGRVVEAAFDSPASEFGDALHLAATGRRRLARRISAEAAPFLRAEPDAALDAAAMASERSPAQPL